MADLSKDKIDFTKLERELDAAVKAEAKYWRENDAKLRAVEQRVETYEQFKDMVAAAHLQPLEKKDKISESKLEQPWNPLASKQVEVTQNEDSTQVLVSDTLPTNNLEFKRDWKRFCKTDSDKCNFLRRMGSTHLSTVLKCEIGMDLLGEFLVALDSSVSKDTFQGIFNILRVLPDCGRFGLALGFLSKTEKKSCEALFEKIENFVENEGEDGGTGDEVRNTEVENVGVNIETLKELKIKYDLQR